MSRVIVSALALALLPGAVFAQNPPPAQPPPAQPPPAQAAPAAPAQPGVPKVGFNTPAGMLLVQIKPDQTTAFEEMMAKMKPALAAATDANLKQQGSFKVYKSAEASGGNALYVVVFDPAVPGAEYSFLEMFNKTLTPEQQRDPVNVENFKKWAGAFAGMNILNLSPVGGGM
ncbi:MAG: hypothetical protein H0W08_12715 [Acidobacteria bacterium]|nr:hypothetical protein [Acidobacteriota bacterium]